MPLPPSPPLLDTILRAVPRRYRVPSAPEAATRTPNAGPATTLAMTGSNTRARRLPGAWRQKRRPGRISCARWRS